jgi:predicted O-linked N-acetylglucosamine transferase (SPINDLY family)
MTSLRVSDPQTDRPLTVSHLGVTATSFWGSDAEAAARGSPARPLRVFEWIAREHKAWGRHLLAQLAAAGTPAKTWTITDPASARPLRIGIVSSDLMTHSVSYFIEALLRHANPRAVHNICFSTNPRPDARTAYLRSLSHAWVDLSASSGNASADAAARASIIEAHGVDVLVELNGHTAGNQLEALARAPAPVAVSWIGYPYSTGLPNIDYRLVDATTDPVPTPDADPIGFTDAHASERLVRLPGCFLCYTPPAQSEWSTPPPPPPATTPPVRGTVSLVDPSMGPGAAPYRVTFGSFNSMAKISPDVVACWAQILARVPDSRLVLKCKPLSSPDVIARLHAAFEAHGVARCRVKCLPLADSTRAHLASYEQVDIALDTFPYSGTTTTCEALLSNTPVVTFTAPPGVPCHSHNVSASLLRAVGTVTVPAHCGPDGGAQPGGAALDLASGFIAADLRGYITLAVQWAQPQWQSRLAALRAGMRAAVLASPLCDGPRFTRRVEHLWRQLYDWKVAQRSPAAFVPQW